MPNTHATLTDLFEDIADAIRQKKGTSAEIIADDFPSEIQTIPTGGGGGTDVSDTTATASDVKSGLIFHLANGARATGSFAGQAKTATPSASQQVVEPDSGKYLSSVTVEAVQTQAKTVSPTTSQQVIEPDSGKLLSSVTVSAIQTQSKTATPSTSQQTISPDSGKFLSSVKVNAISTSSGGYRKYFAGSISAASHSWSGQYSGSNWNLALTFNPGFVPTYIICTHSSEATARVVYDSIKDTYVLTYLGSNFSAVLKTACTLTSSSVVIPCSMSGSWYVRAFS